MQCDGNALPYLSPDLATYPEIAKEKHQQVWFLTTIGNL